MPLVIHITVTVSNAVTPYIKKKRKPTAEIMARKREDAKILKYKAACAAIGQSFFNACSFRAARLRWREVSPTL